MHGDDPAELLADVELARSREENARLLGRLAELEAFLGGNVCSEHPERTRGCSVCDPQACALEWYKEAERLRAALAHYGRHDLECDTCGGRGRPACTCGLDALLGEG